MATTYKARALRYARDIFRRRPEFAALSNAELNVIAARRVTPGLLALARINLQREWRRQGAH